ncbi:MAG: hypothetical protein KGJ62_08230 [Armatimonadetes bacterium]|nr:hypothetical protein [Armatimonadota bacterium]MDE2205264.1 hypothetical protein [Armatimonadota bacterium]
MMVDNSGSTVRFRDQAFVVLNRLTAYAHARNIPVELWGYSRDAQCFYSAQVPGNDSALVPAESNHMTGMGSAQSKTRPVRAMELLLADDAFQTAARPSVLFVTDGDNDYTADTSKFQRDCAMIAAHRGVRVLVDGLSPSNHDTWVRAFQTLPPGRFTTYQDVVSDRDFRNAVGLD